MKKSFLTDLKAYNPNQIDADIVLSANESRNYLFENGFTFDQDTSKYPEANADSLREALASKWNLSKNNFIVGNGSTELLELCVKTYVDQNDTILTFTPSFSMYEIYAKIYNANIVQVPIEKDGTMNMGTFIQKAKEVKPKLIFLCTPNNPTGSTVCKDEINLLLSETDALVIVDEAYIEFDGESQSMIKYVTQNDRLIVARTFSKAYGLAAFRLGYMIASETIINDLLSIKLPYNVNQASIEIGKMALTKKQEVSTFIDDIIYTRNDFYRKLCTLNLTVYTSKANFLFVKSDIDLYNILLNKGILIRSFGDGTYRITIGTQIEMDQVYKVLKEALL
jgi:histidinol-phosphate aminotransferase